MEKKSKYVKQEAIRATAGKEFLALKECMTEMYGCIDDLQDKQDKIKENILYFEELPLFDAYPKEESERKEEEDKRIKYLIYKFGKLSIHDSVDSSQPLKTV